MKRIKLIWDNLSQKFKLKRLAVCVVVWSVMYLIYTRCGGEGWLLEKYHIAKDVVYATAIITFALLNANVIKLLINLIRALFGCAILYFIIRVIVRLAI